MANDNYCNWQGLSGKTYQYWWYPLGQALKDEPGNYIFAHLGEDGWINDYSGQTESLADRCCDMHHKWEAAKECGATHVHARINRGGEQARLAEERDLIEAYNPPCNDR